MSTHAPMALERNVAEAVAALARTPHPHVALPIRQAEHMVGEMKAGAL